MKTRFIVLFAVMLAMLCSCGVWRHQPLVSTQKDSTVVEIRERVEFVHDTLLYKVPVYVEKQVVRADSSHLENPLAVSDANIDSLGFLHHSLYTREQNIPIPTESKTVYRDSIVYQDKYVEVPKPYPVEVKVKQPLSWFQKAQMIGFWVLLCLLIFQNRNWLKNAWAFVRRFI